MAAGNDFCYKKKTSPPRSIFGTNIVRANRRKTLGRPTVVLREVRVAARTRTREKLSVLEFPKLFVVG